MKSCNNANTKEAAKISFSTQPKLYDCELPSTYPLKALTSLNKNGFKSKILLFFPFSVLAWTNVLSLSPPESLERKFKNLPEVLTFEFLNKIQYGLTFQIKPPEWYF